MLQQTQVATVIPYYGEWLRRFPDVATLAAAAESDVLHAWQGLGYYSRARNLHAAARALDGRVFPREPEAIRALPGVGRYTANAVATFAFDAAVPVVEANIARVLARILDLRLPIDSAAGQQRLWSTAAALLPQKNAGAYNSALMDLGAKICLARQPRCEICPVRDVCQAEDPANLPIKKPRRAVCRLTEHHAFAARDGAVLLEQSSERWRGLWILPRLLAAPSAGAPIYAAEFPFTHHRITLKVFGGDGVKPHAAQRWHPITSLAGVAMPSPHRRAIENLVARVG